MKKQTQALLVSLLVLSVSGAARPVFAATELARINDRVITLEDFTKRYQDNLKFFQFKAPSKKGVLEDLIKRELGVQEARKLGLDKDPDISERINTVLYNALLEKKLSAEFEKIHIADGEAKDFYSKNPEIRTSQIFVAIKPGATAEEEKAAQERMRKIQEEVRAAKTSFAEIAQRLSEAPTAANGGDMDFQTRDRLGNVYFDAAMKLRSPGNVSGVVRTELGLHLIKLTAIKPWEQADKPAVKRALFAQHRVELFERYMKELRQQAKVTAHPELLKD